MVVTDILGDDTAIPTFAWRKRYAPNAEYEPW